MSATGRSDDPVATAATLLDLILRARSRARPDDVAAPVVVPPVLVLAGSTRADGEARVGAYREALIAGLEEFSGTLVSGATTAGVAGLAGDLRARRGAAVRAIGYAPMRLPKGASLESSSDRIDEVRRTRAEGFGIAEPVAYWQDILRSGVPPDRVGLIGIGGGPISRVEYLLAAAMGAWLGIVAGSGRSADEVLSGPATSAPTLRRLDGGEDGLRAFAGLLEATGG